MCIANICSQSVAYLFFSLNYIFNEGVLLILMDVNKFSYMVSTLFLTFSGS